MLCYFRSAGAGGGPASFKCSCSGLIQNKSLAATYLIWELNSWPVFDQQKNAYGFNPINQLKALLVLSERILGRILWYKILTLVIPLPTMLDAGTETLFCSWNLCHTATACFWTSYFLALQPPYLGSPLPCRGSLFSPPWISDHTGSQETKLPYLPPSPGPGIGTGQPFSGCWNILPHSSMLLDSSHPQYPQTFLFSYTKLV